LIASPNSTQVTPLSTEYKNCTSPFITRSENLKALVFTEIEISFPLDLVSFFVINSTTGLGATVVAEIDFLSDLLPFNGLTLEFIQPVLDGVYDHPDGRADVSKVSLIVKKHHKKGKV